MPVWTLFVWLVFGLVAAVVTRKKVGGTAPFGQVGDYVIGAAAGVVGGYLFALFTPPTTFGLLLTIVAAAALAVVLILLSGKIGKPKGESS